MESTSGWALCTVLIQNIPVTSHKDNASWDEITDTCHELAQLIIDEMSIESLEIIA